jgi:hypothetical protein
LNRCACALIICLIILFCFVNLWSSVTAGFAIAGVQPLSVHFEKQRKSFVCTL